MDEGRLAVVFRQEEQHRKFVYMMNDIVRARLGLYNNCLEREQHESSVKLLKNCSEVRRSIVRQNVLKKCLEMRKRKIVARDPSKLFGQYGGKPLWAMSRDIDRVIADNHPKLRRMKRVEEVMRHSLESGAILDEEAVTRRMEAFFQLKRREKKLKDKSPERAPEAFKGPGVQRRNFFKPPSWALQSSESVLQSGLPSGSTQPASSDPRRTSDQLKHDLESVSKDRGRREKPSPTNRPPKEPSGKETHHKYSELLDVVDNVSLNVNSTGRLQGISISREDANNEDGVEVEHGKPKASSSGVKVESRSHAGGRRTQKADILTIRRGGESEGEDKKQQQNRDGQDTVSARPRSKLILPPIESSKALVSRQ